ncbi:hypothetical protein [Sansalvadorimonas verongulae]|uniref:hypothetical protein n=1 Tax=Sansalvadorimonas verongulae TaxID=2172824 RepID=UPI0012BC9292|nr:hypothetical protein [Sansalvadorimonas verongulae]MTI12526.1 hypothetical protein [Sansalvadorimonas verongulae]
MAHITKAVKNRHVWTSMPEKNFPEPTSEACKRAMRWQAQAIALSSDRPDYLIINQSDKLMSHFINRPDLIQRYVFDQGLKEKLISSRYPRAQLTKHEGYLLEESAVRYRDRIDSHLDENRRLLGDMILRLESEISSHCPVQLGPTIRLSRTNVGLYSYIGELGKLRCGEACCSYPYLKLLQARQPFFIPVLCHLQIQGQSGEIKRRLIPFASDHMFIMLVHPSQFQKTGRLLKLNRVTCRLKEPMSVNERISSSLLTPDLFRDNYTVIADPWLQESWEMSGNNWARFFKKVCRECNIAVFNEYILQFHPIF